MQEVFVGGWYSLTHLTIKDIAKYSGTSVSTVSRVLNNHPDVSEKARVQVMKIVEQYRYVPNNSARNLVIRESDTVAVVVRGIANPFFTRIIKTIERAIYAEGYSLSLHQIGSRDDELMTAAMLEREKRLRGIIFLGGRFNYSPADVAMLRVPFVCCTYANTFGSLEPERFSSVAIDDKREAYRAVRLLIERGHRRIAALIEAEDGDSISQLRYEGYCTALADAGIPFDPALVECAGSFEMKDAYRAAARLAERAQFTALFAISDAMAMAAMKQLSERGLRIPEDCSVIAIDGLELTNYCVPTLTTLEQPADEMALESVKILAGLLRGEGKNRHVFMETRLREGTSVRSV